MSSILYCLLPGKDFNYITDIPSQFFGSVGMLYFTTVSEISLTCAVKQAIKQQSMLRIT